MRARLELPDGRVLFAEEHALDRWQQRCRPALDVGGAAAALVQLVAAVGVVITERPEWLAGDEDRRPSGYVMLGDAVALPFYGRTVSTCIVAGEPSDRALAERARVRSKRAATRSRRRGKGSQAGDGNGAYGRRGAGYRKSNRREGTL